jgi:endonuclease/exonuclease/phosphatase family metal-dependent hydrolase
LSILSRFPIEETLLAYHPFYSGAVRIGYQDRKQITFATNWLNYPIDYWEALESKKAIDSLEWYQKQVSGNRETLQKIIATLQPSLDHTDSIPFLFCGDFNSGSHLDWTEETKHLNNGYVMPFPSSVLMMEKGFKDSYREMFPNPLLDRGITWSPTFPNAFKDRIDYIYYKGKGIRVKDARIINSGHYKFPSDHAAIMALFEIY